MNARQLSYVLCLSPAAMFVLSTAAHAQQPTQQPSAQTLDTITVTGSRIARTQTEGAAPVSVINREQIDASGFTSVPDLLQTLSENGGETQGQQSPTGAATTPGAQQVNLRGLGPNHTLVLINGRRVADFPLPLNGRSNFTDIGNIPFAMIERVEVLSGSASAVYGSDAMAGVVNFILKKNSSGSSVDYRYGWTQGGGGVNQRLSVTHGIEHGDFHAMLGLEISNKKPLWATSRAIQDSTFDAPDADGRLPRLVAEIYDDDQGENIAPTGNCAGMAGLNEGTTVPVMGDYGPYCGSDRAMAYSTIESERRGTQLYASLGYAFNPNLSWFADVQLSQQKVYLMNDTPRWAFQDAASTRNYANVFFNQASGAYEAWWRQFAPEEMGQLRNGMNRTTQKTFGITTGLEGNLGEDWTWEAAFSHSQYKAEVDFARIDANAANTLFLGPLLGYDSDGYAIFNAPHAQAFAPLTPHQFASIARRSVFKPKAQTNTLGVTFSNPALWQIDERDVGVALTAEAGRQFYRIAPDPLALDTTYYGARYGDGRGERTQQGLAGELRLPVAEQLNINLAGRYDRYSYSDKDAGKFTYSMGLEWRPLQSLLVRGSYNTGFRAPDLHYLFAGEDYFRTRATDYYRCRLEDPNAPISDCRSSLRRARVTNIRMGNPELGFETSRSFSAGLVFSPHANFDASLDYYRIRIENQVQDLSIDRLLREEANCRLGMTMDGEPVDPTTPSCIDAIARIRRDAANGNVLLGSYFNPINIAHEETSGVDVAANWRLPDTRAGDFRIGARYTWVHKHDSQQYPNDPVVDQLAVDSGYYIPRRKGNISIGWQRDNWGANLYGHYLGRISNYDNNAWTPSSWKFNASLRYRINPQMHVQLGINNLLDKKPPYDGTYRAYPYYDISWYDSVGRSFYLQWTWNSSAQ